MSSTPDDASGTPQPGSPADASDGAGAAPIPGLEQLTLPECREVIGHLAAQVNELQALVAVLQERLKLDSKNSSEPPSSDGPGSGNRAQRRASERARGAQKGQKHRAALPAGVPSGQIGPLGTRYHLTQFKIRDLLAQVTGVDFSVGAISQAHGKLAQALAAPVHEAIASLAEAPILHMDETRYPREGTSGNWVWGVVSPTLAVYSLLSSPARYVITRLIGEKPQGIVVSDRYAGYAQIPPAQRQVYWSHLIRDFIRISERAGLPGRIGANLLGSAYVLFRWRAAAKSAAQFEPLQRRVERALRQGRDQTVCRRTTATCANLLRSLASLWTFLRDPRVAPTNNDAERALRGIVIKRKISGPTRSRRGDEFIGRAFTAHESCRRQGRNLWDFLHQAVTAWIDKTAPPSLLPIAARSG